MLLGDLQRPLRDTKTLCVSQHLLGGDTLREHLLERILHLHGFCLHMTGAIQHILHGGIADTEPLERDFGFKPHTPLRDGLRKFAEWYKEFYMA